MQEYKIIEEYKTEEYKIIEEYKTEKYKITEEYFSDNIIIKFENNLKILSLVVPANQFDFLSPEQFLKLEKFYSIEGIKITIKYSLPVLNYIFEKCYTAECKSKINPNIFDFKNIYVEIPTISGEISINPIKIILPDISACCFRFNILADINENSFYILEIGGQKKIIKKSTGYIETWMPAGTHAWLHVSPYITKQCKLAIYIDGYLPF
jgi:hypothetical protein